MDESKPAAADLRTLMPFAAEVVGWLRAQLGRDAADAIVRKGMRGQGGFYVREQGADGVVREFGSRSRKVDGEMAWPAP